MPLFQVTLKPKNPIQDWSPFQGVGMPAIMVLARDFSDAICRVEDRHAQNYQVVGVSLCESQHTGGLKDLL